MGDITKSYPFKFSLESDPSMFSFETYVPSIHNRIILQDSIFNFFPYMELVIMDDAAIFTELNFFVDQLDLKVKLMNPDEKDKLEHNFYWSEYQLNDISSNEVVVGAVMYPCKSNFLKQDEYKSESYEGDISTVVRQIMSQYKFPGGFPKLEIGQTANFDTWYQSGYNWELIKTLSKYALSPIYPNSPFLTFINCKSEFHFMSLGELFDQRPVETLYFGLQDDINQYNKDLRNDVIRGFSFQSLGAPITMDTLRSTYYRVDEEGEYLDEDVKLTSKMTRNRIGQNKVNIRKQDLELVRSSPCFGIVDSFFQKSMYSGWVNSQYLDTFLSHRLKVEIDFNPKICSGKTIETKFLSPNDEKDNKATEYSGKWLVLECGHAVDENGKAITVMDVGKSSLKIDRKHKFFQDFV